MHHHYETMLGHVLDFGTERSDRTGTGTLSIFGGQMRFDLREQFPLITSKKVFWKGVVHELLWMLSGSTNVRYLQDNGVHIWDAWAGEDGELGPVYGAQWRSWEGVDDEGDIVFIDQIRLLIEGIQADPHSRRHIVSAWNVADLPKMNLAPCHAFMQFYVADGELSCHLYQRSADMFLGVPFNIASYALLTHMVAAQTGLAVGDFVHSFGDAHIYLNHVDQVKEQLARTIPPFPKFVLPHAESIFDYNADEVIDGLVGYHPHPAIKGEVAV